jgi:hypothetical protein
VMIDRIAEMLASNPDQNASRLMAWARGGTAWPTRDSLDDGTLWRQCDNP